MFKDSPISDIRRHQSAQESNDRIWQNNRKLWWKEKEWKVWISV
jgi:hypothetical protein